MSVCDRNSREQAPLGLSIETPIHQLFSLPSQCFTVAYTFQQKKVTERDSILWIGAVWLKCAVLSSSYAMNLEIVEMKESYILNIFPSRDADLNPGGPHRLHSGDQRPSKGRKTINSVHIKW